jgi:peptidyl-tRNA hydrolase
MPRPFTLPHSILPLFFLTTLYSFLSSCCRRGAAKITLKLDNEEQMATIAAAAIEAGLPQCVIEDAGRTEIPEGSRTVLGIGPAPKNLIDALTGPKGRFPLKLLT